MASPKSAPFLVPPMVNTSAAAQTSASVAARRSEAAGKPGPVDEQQQVVLVRVGTQRREFGGGAYQAGFGSERHIQKARLDHMEVVAVFVFPHDGVDACDA